MDAKGFSFIELMMVVTILGILAAVSIPQYNRFVIRSLRTDAVLTLHTVHKAQMGYYSSNDEFYPPGCNIPGTGCYESDPDVTRSINVALGLSLVDDIETPNGFIFRGPMMSDTSYQTFSGVINGEFKSVGYMVQIVRDMDHDPDDIDLFKEDWWHAGYNRNSKVGYANVPNDGTPWMIIDDFKNQSYF